MIFLGGSAELNLSPTLHLIQTKLIILLPRRSLSLKGGGLGRGNLISCKSFALMKKLFSVANHSIGFPTQIRPSLLLLLSGDFENPCCTSFQKFLEYFQPPGYLLG